MRRSTEALAGEAAAARIPLRVLCVEDCRTFGDLLTLALDQESDLECVGATSSLDEAGTILERQRVDVVIVDHDAPEAEGIDGIRQLKRRQPAVRVLVLARHPTIELLLRSAASEADAFLAKDATLRAILDAIRDPTPHIELDEKTMEALRRRIRGEGALGGRVWHPGLTGREQDVLALLAEGLDCQFIARHLRISPHTSRGYVRNVLSKLGAHTQLEAVVIAVRAGIVQWPPLEPANVHAIDRMSERHEEPA